LPHLPKTNVAEPPARPDAAAELQSVRQGPDAARRSRLALRFAEIRGETERRAARLSAEDQMLQSMADASPTKWHRAHTTWFFEQFVLGPHWPSYRVFDPAYAYLFNSYYVGAGERHPRPQRGLLSRPSIGEVSAYRAHVDAAIFDLLGHCAPAHLDDIARLITLGLHHEQQHQELLVTDILHAFAQNPLCPAYDPNWTMAPIANGSGAARLAAGVREIGTDPARDDARHAEPFAFDNEGPRHRVLIEQTAIARDLVTNAEWRAFMDGDGYASPQLWLMDGYGVVAAEGWEAPGYWRREGDDWRVMTPGGLKDIDPHAPVCHVSYYEADAFARWAGKRLPSEAEWEVAARENLLNDAFGAVWQWTASAYLPYPGFQAPQGAIGEYNGKFMVNQMVLRGSSRETPAGHARISYRNFFYPQQRWQLTGLRLASHPA